jgi:hypothetical protein
MSGRPLEQEVLLHIEEIKQKSQEGEEWKRDED